MEWIAGLALGVENENSPGKLPGGLAGASGLQEAVSESREGMQAKELGVPLGQS